MRSINDIPQGKYINMNTHTHVYITNKRIIYLDDATKKKILDIIEHQFDLEIYLKYREIDTIRKEINKAQDTLRDLHAAIENGKKRIPFL